MDAPTPSARSDSAPVQISAATRVFALPELLHEILLQLSVDSEEFKPQTYVSTDPRVWKITVQRPAMCNLFVLRRVSHLWQDTINTSTPLKKTMWLVPDPKERRLNPVALWCIFTQRDGNETRDVLTMHTIRRGLHAQHLARLAKLSPLQEAGIRGDKCIRLGTSNQKQSWRDMYVMNRLELGVDVFGRDVWRGEMWLGRDKYKASDKCTFGQIYDRAKYSHGRNYLLWSTGDDHVYRERE